MIRPPDEIREAGVSRSVEDKKGLWEHFQDGSLEMHLSPACPDSSGSL
jgi:hypothetical protein